MRPIRGLSRARLARIGVATAASLVMTLLCLLGVRALTAERMSHAEPPPTRVPVAIPLVPPPDPTDPAPNELPELVPTPSLEAVAPELAPPPLAAPALASLAPAAGPGSLALGPIGGLPSVSGLPSASFESDTTDEQPTTPARATARPPPEYPAIAQRRGIEGFVTLRLRIDERGRVVDAVVVAAEPPGVFDRAAKQAVRRYRFSPARSGTDAIPSTLQQTIRFELDR